MGIDKYKKQQWGQDFLTSLPLYTYAIWKARNEMLRGRNAKEANRIKTEVCIQYKSYIKYHRSIWQIKTKRFFGYTTCQP